MLRKILSKWYIYLATITLVIASFCIVTSIKTEPRGEEKINFIIVSRGVKNELKNFLNDNKPTGLKKIEFRFVDLETKNLNYIFSTLRGSSDFFILPLDYAEENSSITIRYSANIKTDYLNEKIGEEATYYYQEEYAKGIKIYDGASKEGYLKDYIIYNKEDETKNYYLFFTFNSKNIGQLNNSSSEKAFEVLKEIRK